MGNGGASANAISLPSHLFRRLLHLNSALIMIFYIYPDTVLGVPKELWLILLFGVLPFLMEYIRLSKGIVLFGQRPHEATHVGSYAWSLWASLVIVLVMPQQVALPVIIIYAFGDPLIGELRLWKKRWAYPVGFVAVLLMFLVFNYNLLLAAYGAFFLLVGEAIELQGIIHFRSDLIALYPRKETENFCHQFRTDDDSTTQIIPAIFLGLLYLIFPTWFPDPWFQTLSIFG